MSDFQLFPPLDAATEAALRASIELEGVLVPVIVDQAGRIIDGHHRARIAEELGVDYATISLSVNDDEHGRVLAAKLNAVRRQLKPKQRRLVVGGLRQRGLGITAIAKALGVSVGTVHGDLQVFNPENLPDSITGRDGKLYPAKRAKDVVPGDVITDDCGDEREVAAVEADGEEVVLYDDEGEAIVTDAETVVTTRSPVTKPDLGGGVSHPARYSAELMPILQAAVPPYDYKRVLDPFAGTGRIHELLNVTVGVEIEPEWAELHPDTRVGSALELRFIDDSFDAIVTSPTYGNRLADHHNAYDPENRRSYTHDLGRDLNGDNSGAMQWGDTYRDFHRIAWGEAWRVLRPGGRLVLNIKDHVRKGDRQYVAGWHVSHLINIGFVLVWCLDVPTSTLRQGENTDLRYPEQVFVLEKPS